MDCRLAKIYAETREATAHAGEMKPVRRVLVTIQLGSGSAALANVQHDLICQLKSPCVANRCDRNQVIEVIRT